MNEPTDTYDVYDGPEHRGSVEVPRGTDRGRLDTAVVEKFGVRFDRVVKRLVEEQGIRASDA